MYVCVCVCAFTRVCLCVYVCVFVHAYVYESVCIPLECMYLSGQKSKGWIHLFQNIISLKSSKRIQGKLPRQYPEL